MMPLISISAILLLTIFLYNYIIYPVFVSPLSKIPCVHWTSRFSSYWINSQRKNRTTGVRYITKLHNVYGPVLLISPTEISICSLDGLRRVYTSGAWEKSSFYIDFHNYDTPNLVAMVANKPHSAQKRMMTNVFSKSFVQTSKDLDKLTRILIFGRFLPEIEKCIREKDGVLDAFSMANALGADFVNAYLFGIQNGTDFIRDVKARDAFMVDFRIKFKQLPGTKESGKVIEDFILRMCEAAEKPSSYEDENNEQGTQHTSPVVYSQLLSRLQKESTSSTPPRIMAASEMMDQIAATIETTRVTLVYLQWELSRNSKLMKSLRQELLTLNTPVRAHGLDNGTSFPELPDPKALDALPLLNAILKETLRVYTPSPAIFPRLSPPQGGMIDGYFIPGGMSVGAAGYCLHRNESVYPEAELFKPERWLENCTVGEVGGSVGVDGRKGAKTEMEKWYWPFGSGGRMCIGSHFAVHLLKTSIAAIYTNYTTSIVDDEDIEPEEAFIASPVGEKLVLRYQPVS